MTILEGKALYKQRGSWKLGPKNLALGPGVWQLTGGNGAGKTTLLRMIVGDLRPDGGTVRVEGEDIHREARARRKVAYLPANPELPAFLGIEESWRMMAALRGAPEWEGRDLCARLGLRGEQRMGATSVGQRRKAEFLSAVAGDPKVLLFDEIFAPLDPSSAAVIADWIGMVREERVILITAHGGMPLQVDGVVQADQ